MAWAGTTPPEGALQSRAWGTDPCTCPSGLYSPPVRPRWPRPWETERPRSPVLHPWRSHHLPSMEPSHPLRELHTTACEGAGGGVPSTGFRAEN